jgi:heme/copper-type cytochrome/quinol oxidase subunit 2
MFQKKRAMHQLIYALVVLFLGLAALAIPTAVHSQIKSPSEAALDLLLAQEIDPAELVITAIFDEIGMYTLRFDMQGSKPICPRGLDLNIPVGVETDVNVTSNGKIVRWSFPQVGFDVTAVPGRISSRRLKLTEPGKYQVRPPSGNEHKVSDIPMHVMTEAEFKDWFKKAKLCPQ